MYNSNFKILFFISKYYLLLIKLNFLFKKIVFFRCFTGLLPSLLPLCCRFNSMK